MSLARTGGWKEGHPYAFNYDTAKIARLGTPIWPIFGRIKYPVNLDQARGEAVSIDAHRALELTLALFSTELSDRRENGFNSVAIACLTTNTYLPQEIQHSHAEMLRGLGETRLDIEAQTEARFDKTQYALGWVREAIQEYPDLYVGEDPKSLKQALNRLSDILTIYGPDHDPRDILISHQGNLTSVAPKSKR